MHKCSRRPRSSFRRRSSNGGPNRSTRIPQPRRGLAQRVQATFPNWKNVKPVNGEAELAPGVRAIPAFGHTQGHTVHLISSGGRQLLVTADATNIQALFVKNPGGRRRLITSPTWRWRPARSCSTGPSLTRPWSPAITGACRTSARSPGMAAATHSRRPKGDDTDARSLCLLKRKAAGEAALSH